MTDQELAEIKERCDKATGGEWEVKSCFADWGFPYQAYILPKGIKPKDNNDIICSGTKGTHQCIVFDHDEKENPCVQFIKDLDFIAHSRTDIPALLTEIERLKANYKAIRNELCLKCGKYREAHNGACKGCRWGEI